MCVGNTYFLFLGVEELALRLPCSLKLTNNPSLG